MKQLINMHSLQLSGTGTCMSKSAVESMAAGLGWEATWASAKGDVGPLGAAAAGGSGARMDAGAVANGDTGPGCLPRVTELMGACKVRQAGSVCDSCANGLGSIRWCTTWGLCHLHIQDNRLTYCKNAHKQCAAPRLPTCVVHV